MYTISEPMFSTANGSACSLAIEKQHPRSAGVLLHYVVKIMLFCYMRTLQERIQILIDTVVITLFMG
jgi:hypothetical protein